VPTPTATATATATAPRGPRLSAPGLNVLPLPPAASGDGILSVNATPWGRLRVDGVAVGDTPHELRLPAGRHRVRIERKGRPPLEVVVVVKAGRRTQLLR
jgi:hypothetical protein